MRRQATIALLLILLVAGCMGPIGRQPASTAPKRITFSDDVAVTTETRGAGCGGFANGEMYDGSLTVSWNATQERFRELEVVLKNDTAVLDRARGESPLEIGIPSRHRNEERMIWWVVQTLAPEPLVLPPAEQTAHVEVWFDMPEADGAPGNTKAARCEREA